MTQPKTIARLIFADSESDANAYFVSGVCVPDPFLILILEGGQTMGVLNRLEFSRVQRCSRLTQVLEYERLDQEAKSLFGVSVTRVDHIIRVLAQKYALTGFEVPSTFPAGVALRLMEAGFEVTATEGHFCPGRGIKTPEQARLIKEANGCAAAGIRAAETALRRSRIVNGCLYLGGRPLTSERLRAAIDTACLKAGAVASGTICAGGDQACDPHERGNGPLKANELIIVDVFPRSMRSRYFGDMTRTFLKGVASEAQRSLVEAVQAAQQAAIAVLRSDVPSATVHKAVMNVFEARGFKTCKNESGVWTGFFHSTGHGLGLEVHEMPRVSDRTTEHLQAGAVVTIEPGLYYPGLGGCRIEDVYCVGEPSTALSSYPYRWELP